MNGRLPLIQTDVHPAAGSGRLHNLCSWPEAQGKAQRLEVGPDVAAVLRPEEATRLHEIRNLERLSCRVCGEWIEPDSTILTNVSVSLEEDSVAAARFSHADCAPSQADLAPLVILAQAESLGIAHAQALHPVPADRRHPHRS